MKKLITLTIIILTLISSNYVLAENTPSPAGSTGVPNPAGSSGEEKNTSSQKLVPLINPLKVNSVEEIVLLIVDIAVYLGISFSILAIIYVGFKFVMAQGNPTKIEEAKEWFFYIIIGLAILISSRVIVEIIRNTLVKSGVADEKILKL